jgi:ATP-binding cassette subfamily B protein
VGRLVRRLSRKSQDALAKAGEVAEETFSGIRTVRTFNREPMEVSSYSEQVEDAFQLSKTRSKAVAIFMGATSFAGYASIAVVLWYGGRLVLENSMSVGELISFILYTLIVSGALGVLASIYANFMRAAGASERVFSLMERVTSIPRGSGITLPNPEGKVSFQDVHFAYPTRPDITVLQNINLSVSPGERIALVGPSGSGKSTIAALISRLYDPVSGVISLDDVALTELEAGWLREQIGVVSQEPILFSASIAQNIRYARTDATDAEIKEAARIANALEFVEDFPEGMETQVGERGVQLSGGQKQRIAIARAVLKNPKILILDEATSALDTESEYLVKEALERLMQNRTTLVIAHRLSTVQGADRVLVIHRGKVEEEGTHAQLLEQGGIYNRLVERQLVQVA